MKIKFSYIILIVVATLATGFFLGVEYGIMKGGQNIPFSPALTSGEKEVQMSLPAVDNEGDGVLANFTARVRQGSGLVLVSINDIIAGYDTQLSARTAVAVAANFTKTDIKGLDVIFQIKANASVIEGPSAGAAMALALIAALKNETLRNDVVITGTIEEDGRIGKVGAILEKAQAAKEGGATFFLVPAGQGTKITSYEKNQTCKKLDGWQICQTQYVPKTLDISQELGIEVREVKNVAEAISYFEQK